MAHDQLLEGLRKFARTAPSADDLMEYICHRLHEQFIRYNWVGFYVVDSDHPESFRVGPYVGSFSHPDDGPDARIPFSVGLCGAAAISGETIVVNDVSKDPRYVAGSSMVKSEIVIPIFSGNRLVAELDINSYFEGTFDAAEQSFDEACAAVVGKYMTREVAGIIEKRPADAGLDAVI